MNHPVLGMGPFPAQIKLPLSAVKYYTRFLQIINSQRSLVDQSRNSFRIAEFSPCLPGVLIMQIRCVVIRQRRRDTPLGIPGIPRGQILLAKNNNPAEGGQLYRCIQAGYSAADNHKIRITAAGR